MKKFRYEYPPMEAHFVEAPSAEAVLAFLKRTYPHNFDAVAVHKLGRRSLGGICFRQCRGGERRIAHEPRQRKRRQRANPIRTDNGNARQQRPIGMAGVSQIVDSVEIIRYAVAVEVA